MTPETIGSGEPAERRFTMQQHRFRGLIAEFKSRRFVEDRKVLPAQRFRSSFSNLLLEMRAALGREQYRPMLEWMAEMTSAQLSELTQTPTRYDDLTGIYPRAPVVPLEDELVWIAERLRIERASVAAFLSAKAAIERKTLAGHYEEAIEGIALIQQGFGVTLWSVQLRLALEHQAGGLERQKRYSAEVRAVYKRGLLGFITYHSSVRNEDRTTLAKFVDDIEGRIANHPYYSDATKTYSRYRLKNEFPATLGGLAEILRCEQSHGIIDVFETYVAVLQELAGRAPDENRSALIVRCASTVGVDDFRLMKVAHLLDPTVPIRMPPRDRGASDALLTGNAARAGLMARQALRGTTLVDPWQYIYLGFALAHGSRVRNAPVPSPATLARMIGRVQSRCDGSADAWAQTAKLALNFRGLPIAAAVLDLLRQLHRNSPDAPWQPWLVGLNSPTLGIEDRRWDRPLDARTLASTQSTERTWREAFAFEGGVRSAVSCLARAAGCVRRRQFDAAIQILGAFDQGWPEPIRALRALLLLHAYHARGERQSVIALIASEGSRSTDDRQFLPVVGSLKGYEWADFRLVTRPLAAPIALHLLWTAQETSLTASQMRYATGAALRQAGVSRPSQLSMVADAYLRHELIYFLFQVCVPNILDLSRLFRSTREIMEERQAICGYLEELDPQRASEYRDEVVLISNQLALDEGQWIVDSTRIHVDSDALVRWALRELSEDYDRYRDLAPVSVEAPQSFEDVLRELIQTNAQRTTFTPDNEADAVLVSLMKRMGEEFLTNATFGLDYYLSKRVRHQSFIGLIRGPIELAYLITTRESEVGEYHRNEAWVDRFQRVDADALDRIDAALRHFAAQFDDKLTRAKDTHFHLRSFDKPQGMIILTLTDRQLALARALVRLDFDFRDFLRFAIVVLWAAIEPSLADVRKLIAEDIKAELIEEFDTVRAAVREVAEHDPAFLEFDAAMGRGSAEVQVKLDEAAQWFVHADTVANQRLFTLNQILRIGLDAALKTQRGYSPRIVQATEGDLELHAANLVFVHDVLFVGIGNAQKHSGLKTPNIDVTARWNEAESTLAIEVVSDCRSSSRTEKSKQADVIRDVIARGSHSRRTRIEGGSGFAKLAAVVGQSERSRLEFGFTPEGRFRLEVSYSVIQQPKWPTDAT